MSRKYTASEAGHRPDRRWEMVDSFVLYMERIEDTGLDCTSFCYLLACFHLCGYFLSLNKERGEKDEMRKQPSRRGNIQEG